MSQQQADEISPQRGSALLRFGQALGSVPAFFFALAFLALIPSYALIYYFLLPGDFLHETVTHERAYVTQQRVLVDELRATIRTDLTAAYGGNVIDAGDDFRLCIDRIDIVNFAPTAGGEVSFSLIAPLVPAASVADDSCPRRGASDVVMLNAVSDYGESIEAGISAAADATIEVVSPWLTVRFADASSHVGARRVFPEPAAGDTFRIGDDPVYHEFALPVALNNQIIGLIRASQGFPRSIPGEFWRMVYLSATTATTLGYGDIVPLTTAARLTTSSEAIVGVVMVGLFLNSLTQGGLLKLLPLSLPFRRGPAARPDHAAGRHDGRADLAPREARPPGDEPDPKHRAP